jgi:hypothetical protein
MADGKRRRGEWANNAVIKWLDGSILEENREFTSDDCLTSPSGTASMNLLENGDIVVRMNDELQARVTSKY